MRNKYNILAILAILFIGILLASNLYKKDAANLVYTPPLAADNTPITITITGIGGVVTDINNRVFVEDTLLEYLIKYEQNPTNTFTITNTSEVKKITNDNSVTTTDFFITDSSSVYSVSVSGVTDLWVSGTIKNTSTGNTYKASRDLRSTASYK
jgi:hypothetical protein